MVGIEKREQSPLETFWEKSQKNFLYYNIFRFCFTTYHISSSAPLPTMSIRIRPVDPLTWRAPGENLKLFRQLRIPFCPEAARVFQWLAVHDAAAADGGGCYYPPTWAHHVIKEQCCGCLALDSPPSHPVLCCNCTSMTAGDLGMESKRKHIETIWQHFWAAWD